MNPYRLLCAFPTTKEAAKEYFKRRPHASFCIEFIRSQGNQLDPEEIFEAYLKWAKILQTPFANLPELEISLIPNARSDDLMLAMKECEIIIIAAHNATVGIEMLDRVVPFDEISLHSPRTPAIIHTYICNSESFAHNFKKNCAAVRVVTNKLAIDPLYAIQDFYHIAKYWRHHKIDYIDALFQIRLAMIKQLT